MAVRPFDEIFRDFVVNGLPASGSHHPHKADIRDSLNAVVAGPFPDNRVIKLNNANDGTANNIIVTASVAIPTAVYQVLYVLNVTQENTGPVSVTGAINRALVTNTSEPIPAGYLTPGMALLCIDTGSELRLLSYGDSEAVQAAAEAAASRAEAAAASLNLPNIANGDAGKSLVVNDDEDGYVLTRTASVQVFDNTATAQLAKPSLIVEVIETVNDIGTDRAGGQYIRVASEPVGKKIQTADGSWWSFVGFKRPGASAIARPYVQKVAEVFTPQDYGAMGDGTSSDNKLADAVSAAVAEHKTLHITGNNPSGYNINVPLIIDMSDTTTVLNRKRPAIRGESAGTTIINYTGTGGAVRLLGSGTGEGHHSFVHMSDFTLVGPGATTAGIYGIDAVHQAYFRCDRINIDGFDIGYAAKDIEFSKFNGVNIRWNRRGVFLDSSGSDMTSSQPNGNTFRDCEISLNSDYGVYVIGGTQVGVIDSHIQYNGVIGGHAPGDLSGWGVRVQNAGFQGGVGLNMFGCYVEHNAGLSDVWLNSDQFAGGPLINPVVHNIIATSFSRVTRAATLPQAPARHNIFGSFLDAYAGVSKLNVIGCAFKYYNDYVPNALNKVIAFDPGGAPMDPVHFYEAGNIYMSSLEKPDFMGNLTEGGLVAPLRSLPATGYVGQIVLNLASGVPYVWTSTDGTSYGWRQMNIT